MMKDMAIAFLEQRDLTAADLPTFILLHTALSALWVSSTWYWCYQNPSSHAFVSRRVHKHLRIGLQSANSNPGRVQRLLQNTVPSLDATKLATSFVEAKLGRLVAKPITIPARLWISWQGTLVWKQQHAQIMMQSSGKQPNKKQRTMPTTRRGSTSTPTTRGRRSRRNWTK